MRTVVLIADDPRTVQGIRIGLRHAADFRLAAAIDGRSSVRRPLSELRPDIVLVHEMCQRANVWMRLREVVAETPDAKVVLLSADLERAAIENATAAGAQWLVSRDLHPATLGTALQWVVDGSVAQTRAGGAAPSRRPSPVLRLAGQLPVARTSA